MFRLTREVRFAINDTPDDQLAGRPTNTYGGFPSITGLAHYFTLAVTLQGELDASSQYVRNIKEIDDQVRRLTIGRVERHVREHTFGGGGHVVAELFQTLHNAWPGAMLTRLSLNLSPCLAFAVHADNFRPEHPVVHLSQKFEFSATHRLHNAALSDEKNQQTFGKCNNPYGHGHNYEVQVTVSGEPNEKGVIAEAIGFEKIVAETVIDRFDHKNLNVELPEFADTIPSVENIARVMYRLLKPKFDASRAKLASVTVWETPKTWCEYSE